MPDNESLQHLYALLHKGFEEQKRTADEQKRILDLIAHRDEKTNDVIRVLDTDLRATQHRLETAVAQLTRLTLIVEPSDTDKALASRIKSHEEKIIHIHARIDDADKNFEAIKNDISKARNWALGTLFSGIVAFLTMACTYAFEKLQSIGVIHK